MPKLARIASPEYDVPQRQLIRWMGGAQRSLGLASAYCTANGLRSVLPKAIEKLEFVLIVRWGKRDILTGASDLKSFEVVRSAGGTMLRLPNLHAKWFCRDEKELYLGSANLTVRGLGLSEKIANVEAIAGPFAVTKRDMGFWEGLVNASEVVSCEMVEELQSQLDVEDDEEWDEARIKLVSENLPGLRLKDFPGSPPDLEAFRSKSVRVKRDLALLSLSGRPKTDKQLSIGFRKSRIFKWLLRNVTGGLRFGVLKAKVKSALRDEPAKSSPDIAVLQARLLKWIKKFASDKFEITPRNHRGKGTQFIYPLSVGGKRYGIK